LALSRAIGDFEFKQNPNLAPEDQIVTGMITKFFFLFLYYYIFNISRSITAFPDVRKEQITSDTEFLVLACDGNLLLLFNFHNSKLFIFINCHPLFRYMGLSYFTASS
jgi:hypothetical protein